jgi:hypothetical protein
MPQKLRSEYRCWCWKDEQSERAVSGFCLAFVLLLAKAYSSHADFA